MKLLLVLLVVVCCCGNTPGSGQSALPADSEFCVVQRSGHSRTWERLEISTESGEIATNAHRFVELSGAVCYEASAGEWRDSDESFEVTPDGHAVAARCQHRLVVAADLADPHGTLECWLPDGARFRTALLGINLYSPGSGKSLQIAGVKSCAGTQIARNEIVFLGGLEGVLGGSVRVRNERDRFHHDVLLAEKFSPGQLAKLAEAGFDPATMRLEIWSAVLESPTAIVQPAVWKRAGQPERVDDRISLGSMRLAAGRSFVDGTEHPSAPVLKQWLVENAFWQGQCPRGALADLL